MGTARAQDFPLHHAFLVTCKNAINPSGTNGAITVAAEMRFPRWFEPYICLALALILILILIWDFGSGLVEWLTTGQLRVWCFFGNLDHHVIFSQEPVFFVFGFVTMSVMMVVTLIFIVVLYVED